MEEGALEHPNASVEVGLAWHRGSRPAPAAACTRTTLLEPGL